jgi:hypothetical protein
VPHLAAGAENGCQRKASQNHSASHFTVFAVIVLLLIADEVLANVSWFSRHGRGRSDSFDIAKGPS